MWATFICSLSAQCVTLPKQHGFPGFPFKPFQLFMQAAFHYKILHLLTVVFEGILLKYLNFAEI